MFDSSELRDELKSLKDDVAHLLNTTSDGIFDTTKSRAEAALNDLSETLSEQEGHIERIVSDRPITSLASAFALGVVIGFTLRRH
jgi:ElaB/YqjD/DUF883 family membrane-anchored ribosome-binding protein